MNGSSAQPEAGSGDATAAVVEHPLLALRNVSKHFLGVDALVDVDLECRRGEVHAVVGENGAGKSTLMKIIAGAYQPDDGVIVLDGRPARFAHPQEAQRHGIAIIYQEFNLLPQRTVAQNIFLGREPSRAGLIDGARMEAETKKLLDLLGVGDSISPRARIRDLSVAQQQMVEIAKALSTEAQVLIMDEPTASLSPAETEALFERVEFLREHDIAVLFITHRLQEVFDLAQRITVLKDGRKVGTVPVDEVTPTELVKMMVGRDFEHYFPERARPSELGTVKLSVRDGWAGMLSGISLEVRAGEIVGVAGLEGSGRTELAQAIFGVHPWQRGSMEINGRPARIRSPRQAIRHGLGFITEDRKAEGLVLPRSVLENGVLPLRSLSARDRERRGTGQGGRSLVRDLMRQLDVRAHSLDQEVRYLSGGNQQKLILAKWLATRADVLIFDEPTRGIDVGAKAGIHELMRELAQQGLAILMISSELPEVIGMSDRIIVMRGGEIAGELPAASSESDILLLAAGAAADAGEVADPGPGSDELAGRSSADGGGPGGPSE